MVLLGKQIPQGASDIVFVQGSVHGSSLLLYINDMPKNITSTVHLLADYTVVQQKSNKTSN